MRNSLYWESQRGEDGTLWILGLHFSYNKKLRDEKNFVSHIKSIENLLKIWKMRTLSIEGKINIFKALAISKIVHLAMVTDVPSDIVQILVKMQNTFLWRNKLKIRAARSAWIIPKEV